jgi:hypothetical protein
MAVDLAPEAEFFGLLTVVTSVELLPPVSTFNIPPGSRAGVIVCGTSRFGTDATSSLNLAPLGLSLTTASLFNAGGALWLVGRVAIGTDGEADLARRACLNNNTPVNTITNAQTAAPNNRSDRR